MWRSVKRLVCFLFVHRWTVLRTFTLDTRCIFCKRCGVIYAMNDRVRALVPWDREFTELYNFNPFEYQKMEAAV